MDYGSLKVLVADDFQTMRRVITGVLKDLGVSEVAEAENGAEALKLLKEKSFNFLVTDWNMPEMTGLELIKAVRSHDQLKDIPILMVTTESKKTDIIEAAKAGVNGYVIKPFTAEGLQAKIEKVFDKDGGS